MGLILVTPYKHLQGRQQQTGVSSHINWPVCSICSHPNTRWEDGNKLELALAAADLYLLFFLLLGSLHCIHWNAPANREPASPKISHGVLAGGINHCTGLGVYYGPLRRLSRNKLLRSRSTKPQTGQKDISPLATSYGKRLHHQINYHKLHELVCPI